MKTTFSIFGLFALLVCSVCAQGQAQMLAPVPDAEPVPTMETPQPKIFNISLTGGADDIGFLALPSNFVAVRVVARRRVARFLAPYIPAFVLFTGYVPTPEVVTDSNPVRDFIPLVEELFADGPSAVHLIVAQEREWHAAIDSSLIEHRQSQIGVIVFAIADKPAQLNTGPYVLLYRNDAGLGAAVDLVRAIITLAIDELSRSLGDLKTPEPDETDLWGELPRTDGVLSVE